jgi:hypothetical protein
MQSIRRSRVIVIVDSFPEFRYIDSWKYFHKITKGMDA